MRGLPLLPLLLALSACGRSAEPAFACPQPAADCGDLEEQQTAIEAAFTAAADRNSDPEIAVAKDAVEMEEASQCEQLLVEQSLDLQCYDDVCAELCRLHPCFVLDDAGELDEPAACGARCTTLVDEGAVAAADLEVALLKAAENPGFCTCRACTAAADALCTRLFDCAQ